MLQRKSLGMAVMGMMLATVVTLAGCGNKTESGTTATKQPEGTKAATAAPSQELQNVKIVLDWTPNTNHTGIYVAKEKGYFKEQGLNVDIIDPGSTGSDAMVAAGNAEFGISAQESLTQARIQGVPIVSIAAIIQHNTSGFASPVAKNIKSPKDFEGKTYGGWGSPVENAVIQSLMEGEKAQVSKVKIINMGDADFFTAVKRDVDFAWIYYAWTGIEAEIRNEPINMIYLTKYSDKLDYYTPVLTTNEKLIKENPELIKKFVTAVSKGYEFAISSPDEAADILIKAAPDLDPKLVKASQKWLSPKYKEDAQQWGVQKQSVWENYATWMLDHKLLEKKLEADKAFTNEFLPKP